MNRTTAVLVAVMLAAVFAAPLQAGLQLRWEDRFHEDEREWLAAWVRDNQTALESLVGPLPLDVLIRFHRRSATEPVPWARTHRGHPQGVIFYVDTRFPPQQFREDWTAPHELSHLLLPYLGDENRWFAEGFASFMQYRVMAAAGVLTPEQVEARYRERLRYAAARYDDPERPFAEAAVRLGRQHRYPVMYWGGAAYFMLVDQDLRNAGRGGLLPVLRDYLACCRRNRQDLESLVKTLDRTGGTDAFSARLEQFRTQPGFPTAAAASLLPP